MKIGILGAGPAGVMAHNYLKIKGHDVEIFEKDEFNVVKNSGVFRFKNRDSELFLGSELKKIHVVKEINYMNKAFKECSIKMNNLYSSKVVGEISKRSIMNLNDCDRYILKDGMKLISPKLHANCEIKDIDNYKDNDGSKKILVNDSYSFDYVISTLPLHVNAHLAMEIPFDFSPISHVVWVTYVKAYFKSDLNQTIFYPDLDLPYYRATHQEGDFIIESMQPLDDKECKKCVSDFLPDCEIVVTSKQRINIGKMVKYPDDSQRKRLITELTNQHNIFSLGRFATWRPKLVVDDLLQDIKIIEKLMKKGKDGIKYENNSY